MKTCFVVSPIGPDDSETRRRADQVLKHVITPVAQELGFTIARADKIAEPGIINSQIIQHIVEDDLVIADLTDMNPNVFYELAIRHAIRRPYVQIMQQGQSIPFDVAGVRTIFFDHKDLDSVDDAKRQITAQIESIKKATGPVDSPVSVSLDLQLLKQSADPGQRSFAEIIDQLSDLRRELSDIKEDIKRPGSITRGGFGSTSKILAYEKIRFIKHEAFRILVQMESQLETMRQSSYAGDFGERERGARQLALENLVTLRLELADLLGAKLDPEQLFPVGT